MISDTNYKIVGRKLWYTLYHMKILDTADNFFFKSKLLALVFKKFINKIKFDTPLNIKLKDKL